MKPLHRDTDVFIVGAGPVGLTKSGHGSAAFERFDLPEEIHEEWRERLSLLREMYADMENWFDPH